MFEKKSFTSLSVCKTFKFNLQVPDCRKNHIQYIGYSVYRTPYISEDTIVYDTSTYVSNFTKAEFICTIHYHCYLYRNGNDVGHKKALHFLRMCSRCCCGIREQGGSDIPHHDSMESVPRDIWLRHSILCHRSMTWQTAKLKIKKSKWKIP